MKRTILISTGARLKKLYLSVCKLAKNNTVPRTIPSEWKSMKNERAYEQMKKKKPNNVEEMKTSTRKTKQNALQWLTGDVQHGRDAVHGPWWQRCLCKVYRWGTVASQPGRYRSFLSHVFRIWMPDTRIDYPFPNYAQQSSLSHTKFSHTVSFDPYGNITGAIVHRRRYTMKTAFLPVKTFPCTHRLHKNVYLHIHNLHIECIIG